MSSSDPIQTVRRLGRNAPIGAIVLAEQAVDTWVAGYGRPDDRAVALDILLRDLARLRVQEPGLDGFVAQVESYIDTLHRDLALRAA